MNQLLFAALVLSACLAALGQLCLKLGSDHIMKSTDWFNPYLAAGITLYAIGFALWLYGLSRAPLHTVYPFALLTFVLVGLLGVVVLGERPNIGTIAGWIIISVGVVTVYLNA
jgi:drug/metabolite transporter (DMT)-like permease